MAWLSGATAGAGVTLVPCSALDAVGTSPEGWTCAGAILLDVVAEGREASATTVTATAAVAIRAVTIAIPWCLLPGPFPWNRSASALALISASLVRWANPRHDGALESVRRDTGGE